MANTQVSTLSTTIRQPQARTSSIKAKQLRQQQLKQLAQQYWDILYGYASFFFVAGFLIFPLLLTAAITLYFGLLYGILFGVAAVTHNSLEAKYHPSGLIGRRWIWFNDLLGSFYANFEKIMPLTVVKLGAPDQYMAPRRLLFCFHPHGVLFLGPSTLALRWSHYFPQLTCSHLMSGMIFVAPIFRQFCLWIGGIPVTREAAKIAVNKYGHSLSLIPGGLAEMLQADSRPRVLESWETNNAQIYSGDGDAAKRCGGGGGAADGDDGTTAKKTVVLYMLNRKGFIKLAMQLGLDLVPVFTFGEIENYNQMQWGRRWRLRFSRMFKLPFTMVWGQYGVFPYLKPITVVVDHPIPVTQVDEPDQAQIDQLHKIYLTALVTLFESNKAKYGYPDARLVLM